MVLIQFALPALLVSGAAWLSLLLAGSAPPRLKFWIAMLGLAAWVVPWPLVSWPFSWPFSWPLSWPPLLASRPPVVAWLDEGVRSVAGPLKLAGPLLVGAARSAPGVPGVAWLCLTVPGLAWFAFECAAHRRTLRRWRRESRDGRALSTLLPPAMAHYAASIRILPDSMQAAATGVWRPRIWIGAELRGEALRMALLHEACHVRSRDPLWLLLIELVRRGYCWNPVVAVLARHADLWLEAACDYGCARLVGPRHYRRTLAALLLSAQQRPRAVAALLGVPKQNVRRLELLECDWRVGWRERACVALCAAAAVCGTALAAPHRDPRIGQWAEVGEAAPDGEPILHSFEDLGGGFVRFKGDVMADGTATLSSDYRCDGGSYVVRGRSGEPSAWRLSCRVLDPLTVDVTLAAAGSRRAQHRVDRVSLDGETYTSTLTSRAADGTEGTVSTREYWRLH